MLDIDLDFFVHGAAHMRNSDDPRLDAADAPPWSAAGTVDFLERQCGLDGPLPGVVVEHHADVFEPWGQAISKGHLRLPMSVVHVDAHADLGLGDPGWITIVTDLIHRPVEERAHLVDREYGLDDGNYLAFATACRWIGGLTYVHNDEGGGDLIDVHMQDFDRAADHLQLKAFDLAAYESRLMNSNADYPTPYHVEPAVPFEMLHWGSFSATDRFDAVYLCRSPGFTPAESDELFELIRSRFIDETAWA